MKAKIPNRSSAARTEDATSSQVGEDLDDVTVAGPIGMQGQPSLEEWHELREAMFDELESSPIPHNLIKAVRDFQPHALVTWVNQLGDAAGLHDTLVEPVLAERPRKSPPEMAQFLSDAKIKFDELTEASFPKTAGDALAFCLHHQLALAERKAAPVRSKKMLAKSVIAGVAMYILDTCVLFDQAPGPELLALLRALLKIDKKPLKSSREFSARYNAAWILAQRPSVATRKLAELLEVEPSTVSRWRRDASFKERVESTKRSIQTLKARKLWPPPLLGTAHMENPEIAERVRRFHKIRRVVSRWFSKHRHEIPEPGPRLIELAIKAYERILWMIGPRSI
jgi:hypothetical protein